jgi:hypothetical protein
MTKKWYLSKMLWTNIIGIAVIIFGADRITPEITGTVLGVINLVLRLITKEGLIS